MSREYGKVATRFWTDARVLSLDCREKLVLVFLLAGTQSNCVGCFRCTSHHVAADAVCTAEEAEQALAHLADLGLIQRDPAAGLVWLPRWLRYNPIVNPNMGKAAVMDLLALPASPLLASVVASLESFADKLPHDWREQLAHLFPNEFANRLPNELPNGLGNVSGTPIPSQPTPTQKECDPPEAGAPRARSSGSRKKQDAAVPAEAARLASLLADLIRTRDPKARVDPVGWAPDIDKLHRLDGRDWPEIERVIRWCQADSFEQGNVLSGAKLRVRFTALRARADRANGNRPPVADLPDANEVIAAMDREGRYV